MRNSIIALSIFFFSLSLVIIVKSLNETQRHDLPGAPSAEEIEAAVAQSEVPVKEPSPPPPIAPQPVTKDEATASDSNSFTLAVLSDSAFHANAPSLLPNTVSTIKELAQAILAFGNYRILIEGHTPNEREPKGSVRIFSKNMEFAYLRAKSVADILIENGVAAHQISALSFVDAPPAPGTNVSAENRREQQRVVIKLISEE